MAELAEKLGVTSSSVSQHLKILKNAEIVFPVREGFKTYYKVNKEDIRRFPDDVRKMTRIVFLECKFDG